MELLSKLFREIEERVLVVAEGVPLAMGYRVTVSDDGGWRA